MHKKMNQLDSLFLFHKIKDFDWNWFYYALYICIMQSAPIFTYNAGVYNNIQQKSNFVTVVKFFMWSILVH